MPSPACNPVVVPAYADPSAWLLALVCLGVEVLVVCRLLARVGVRGGWVRDRLVLLQLLSWAAFLVAIDRLGVAPGDWLTLLGLETIVVVVEAVAMRCAFARSPVRAAFAPWPRLLAWSLAGNLASAALCAALACGVHWLA